LENWKQLEGRVGRASGREEPQRVKQPFFLSFFLSFLRKPFFLLLKMKAIEEKREILKELREINQRIGSSSFAISLYSGFG